MAAGAGDALLAVERVSLSGDLAVLNDISLAVRSLAVRVAVRGPHGTGKARADHRLLARHRHIRYGLLAATLNDRRARAKYYQRWRRWL